MIKKPALLLMLAFWLPLHGLAGTLLYCHNSPAEVDVSEQASLHQDHAPLAPDAIPEQTSSEECHTHHQGITHNSGGLDNCDHCQQCCQIGATLLPSPSAFLDAPPVKLKAWPSENADSVIPEPLFHPPQHLS